MDFAGISVSSEMYESKGGSYLLSVNELILFLKWIYMKGHTESPQTAVVTRETSQGPNGCLSHCVLVNEWD